MLLKIARWVRYWFGLQALVVLSSLGFFLYNTWKILQENGLDAETGIRFWVGLGLVAPLEVAIAGVSARAWYALRRGQPSARGWAITASVLSLPVAGIGTIAGIFGLVVFTRREVVSQMAIHPSLERPRLPGDGTNKLLDQIATGGQIVVLLVANHFWSLWAHDEGLPQGGGLLLWLAQFEIALQSSVLLHELGHVFGGWASRMKLRHFVIGPLGWTVRGGKWEFAFTPAGLWGRGATAMAPTSLRDLRGQRVLGTLGGPVGSLVAGCLGLLGALSAKGHAWETWWACFTMLSTLGLSAFVVNLIPLRPEDQYSDGAQLYQLLSGGPWADVHMAFSLAGATLVTPLRARDFDLRLLTRAARFLTHGKEGMLLRLFQYLHHVDAGGSAQRWRPRRRRKRCTRNWRRVWTRICIPISFSSTLCFGGIRKRRGCGGAAWKSRGPRASRSTTGRRALRCCCWKVRGRRPRRRGKKGTLSPNSCRPPGRTISTADAFSCCARR